MQGVEFFSLSRPVQERFIDAAHAEGSPVPILVASPELPYRALAWAGGALALLVSWIGFLGIGFGKLESSLALFPLWTIGVQTLLLGTAIFSGLQAAAVYRKQKALPFLPSLFLFPIGVVDARSSKLSRYPLDELESAEVTSTGVRLVFVGGVRFDFAVPAERRAEALALIESNRDKIKNLAPEDRERELVPLDPLRDNGFSNPFSPAESLRPKSNRARLGYPPIALVSGAVLSALAFFARNSLSEVKIYSEARARDDVAAYRTYLSRGGTRADVTEISLPRAELKIAAREGTVQAVEKYAAAHPGSKIAPEVHNALKVALSAELARAEARGTLAALKDYQAQYGHHGLDSEFSAAFQRHLSGVFAKFKAQAKDDPELLEFGRRLITWGAQKGPRVVVQFRRHSPTTFEAVEKALSKNSYFAGSATLPSRFLDAEHARVREQRYGEEMVKRLQSLFPEEIAHFELGPTLEDPSDDPPKVDVPTLLVTYRHEVSGMYMSRKPRAAFTGIGLFARLYFAVPDQGKPLVYNYKGWHAPDVIKIETGDLEVAQAYDDVVAKAFDKLLKKYWATWFSAAT